jgi:hypothetical protein
LEKRQAPRNDCAAPSAAAMPTEACGLAETSAAPLAEPTAGAEAERSAGQPAPAERSAQALPQTAAAQPTDRSPDAAPAPDPASPPPAVGAGLAGRLVGEVIAYRSVIFAPTNEMGVVMLFAAAAEDLGFALESAATGFPDCFVWKRVANGRLQRLRAELEFASSNFRAHRHDPAHCELVVCWLHDWPACPVPVLELRKEIARLKRERV